MTTTKAVAVLTPTPLPSAQAGKPNIRSECVGVWILVSCEAKDNTTGEMQYPYAPKPVGRITYDAAGRMYFQVLDPIRQMVDGSEAHGLAAAARESSCEQVRAILAGYIAYLGRFEVDEPSCTVSHHIEGSSVPSWVGAHLRRMFEFEGRSQLILTAVSEEDSTRLVWEREIE